jgi:hypothetical protein
MKLQNWIPEKGQTAVEYLLLMAVSVGLCLTFYKKFQDYLLKNPNSYVNSHLNFFKSQYDPNQGLKRYHLPR